MQGRIFAEREHHKLGGADDPTRDKGNKQGHIGREGRKTKYTRQHAQSMI